MEGSITSVAPAASSSSSKPAVASMSMIFERFNEKAVKCVARSQDEARRLGLSHVTTEVLFVGILAENNGIAVKSLKTMNISVKDVRKAVQELVGENENPAGGQVSF